MSTNPTTGLNYTQISYDTARNICKPQYVPIANGDLKYSIGCIATNATSADQAMCVTLLSNFVPLTANCSYITSDIWANKSTPLTKRDPAMTECHIFCDEILNTSPLTSISAPSAPSAAPAATTHASAANVTVYPTFVITFAALLVVMLMNVKRN